MSLSRPTESDEAFVERARQAIALSRRFRWIMLTYAVLALGFSGYCTVVAIRKIENLEAEQLSAAFVSGLAIAVVWASFGVVGALCLAKFLTGLSRDFRIHQLLVRYHDRLRELRALPDEKTDEASRMASGSPPFRR